jgi:tetratricopeptide (TPR) repeat protein
MGLITGPLEAQLHRETYVAILNSQLQAPGSKRELAKRARITPVYLSYLLKLDDESSQNPTLRTPSPQVAERIALALAAPEEVKNSLLEHMVLSNQKFRDARQTLRTQLSDLRPADIVHEVWQMMNTATFARTPEESLQNYHTACQVMQEIIRLLPPERGPLDYVDLCLLLHDSECILNRPDQALWHAKLARTILAQLEPADYRPQKERFDFAEINAARSEGIAFHNLNLNRQALNCYQQAETMSALKQRPDFWKPWLYRDIISALSELPRFHISEIENRYVVMTRLNERRADRTGELNQLLDATELARSYARYGSLDKARRVLDGEYQRLDHIAVCGPLHKVMFYRAYADYCWAVHDATGANSFIDIAKTLAVEAGLTHQLTQIELTCQKWTLESY